MDNFTGIPHIYSPLLYVFEGELIRIGRFIKEVLQKVNVFTGYGELYGLYTHSHGAVVHVTTLKNLNQRQLQDAMCSSIKATENEYSLSLIGEWLTVQNLNISVRELLRKKANTLNGSETYFCLVVEKVQIKFNSEDISKFTQVFYLTKGKIYKMDMKILRQRESPFRLDVDFTDKISLAGYIGNLGEINNGVENEEFFLNGLENIGTELKEMSSAKSKVDTAPLNSENPLNRNENGLPVLENESGNEDSEDKTVLKADPVLPTKATSIEANCIGVKGNTKELGGELEARDRAGQKEVPVEHSTRDDNTWVDIKSSDVLNAEPHSPTKEAPIQAVFVGEEKNNIDHKEAVSVENDKKEGGNIKVADSQVANEEDLSREEDSPNTVLPDVLRKTVATKDGTDGLTEGQEEMNHSPAEHASLTEVEGNTTKNDGELGNTDQEEMADSEGSIPVENLTASDDKIENGNNIIHSGPQESGKNEMGESESTMAGDGEVVNEEDLPSEEDFATTVSPDEERKITVNDGEIDRVAEEQEGMNCAAEANSTGKDKIENGDDVGREAEKFQDIENGGCYDKKSGEFERVTAENETKIEHNGNSVTENENKDGEDSKSQETENGKSDEFSDMGTPENSLSTKEPSNDHDKLDNEQQNNSSLSNEEENLSQEEALDDTSVDNKTSKTEHVVEKKQFEQYNFTSEGHDSSSVPFVENRFEHSEKNNGTSHLMEIELD
ncbi:Hypothetical predicted protein [Paramuricea clavata]|uniref:Uncharacterized protein n=1 Tax=Paramuricea clavata TaxID=317549 RepID=A0A7D9LA05_PARCT|nr:Hypothetical predicted protein [Paramuricea clavata]